MEDYFQIYRDVWQWHKKYIDLARDTESFWCSFLADAEVLHKRYNDSKFARDIIQAEIAEFERVVRKDV